MTGEDLKRRRMQAGLTQEQFAQQLGVSAKTLGNWETGRNEPSPQALRQLRASLRLDVRQEPVGEVGVRVACNRCGQAVESVAYPTAVENREAAMAVLRLRLESRRVRGGR